MRLPREPSSCVLLKQQVNNCKTNDIKHAELVLQRCFSKKVFCKSAANLQWSTHAEVLRNFTWITFPYESRPSSQVRHQTASIEIFWLLYCYHRTHSLIYHLLGNGESRFWVNPFTYIEKWPYFKNFGVSATQDFETVSSFSNILHERFNP